MGLDSVEMIIEWEKYFNIQIPDKQAEKIGTLQEATDYISDYLNITESGLELKHEIFMRIEKILKDLNLVSKPLRYMDYVNKIVFENEKIVWQNIASSLQLEIPTPFFVENNSITTKLFSGLFWTPQINYETLSFNQLVDGICGNNYKKLVDNANIQTKYEVYISIMGITVDKLGVDFYELEPGKSFTSDLGMD